MKIGLFDSGIGGLTLLHRAIQYLPNEEYVFYADKKHVPYGTKKKEEIVQYSREAVEFLIEKGCDIIVIACNTATSVAAETLREEFTIPIIGIEPAVKPAVAHSNGKRILVIGTPTTIREEKLHKLVELVDEQHLVDLKATPKLVMFAENGEFDSLAVKEYLCKELAEYKPESYHCIVLGCTHFNHFKDSLREIFGEDCVFADGTEGTVRNLVATMERAGLESSGEQNIEYYESGEPVTSKETLDFYRKVFEHLNRMEGQ